MRDIYNIYCDESCHLLNDRNKTFVLGAIWVKKDATKQVFNDLRELKKKYDLPVKFEAKWVKISKGKAEYYCDLVRYFFNNQELHFRGVVVPDKGILNHPAFAQNHDTWYYKMFYVLLHVIIKEELEYNLYLDIKDTKSNEKVLELKRILNITSIKDVAVSKAQQIRSNEVELMQIVDILSGALSYAFRELNRNEGKKKVLDLIKSSITNEMFSSSAIDEKKFNVLVWKPRE